MNRYDIIEGHYLYCINNFGVIGSKETQRAKRLRNKGVKVSGYSTLSPNGQIVYEHLLLKYYTRQLAKLYPELGDLFLILKDVFYQAKAIWLKLEGYYLKHYVSECLDISLRVSNRKKWELFRDENFDGNQQGYFAHADLCISFSIEDVALTAYDMVREVLEEVIVCS